MTDLLITVGNDLMGDDAAGPLLARRLRERPVAGWALLEGGSAPENVLHRAREMAPRRVLIVDAADMGLAPGEVRRIGPERIAADPLLVTTHTLPLTFFIEALREFVPQVDLLGIQPSLVAFGAPVAPAVRAAVERIHADLARGESAWPTLELKG